MIELISKWMQLQPGYISSSPTRYYCELTGKTLATRYLEQEWLIEHNNIEEAVRDCVQESERHFYQIQYLSNNCRAEVLPSINTDMLGFIGDGESHAEACLKCWIEYLKYEKQKESKKAEVV